MKPFTPEFVRVWSWHIWRKKALFESQQIEMSIDDLKTDLSTKIYQKYSYLSEQYFKESAQASAYEVISTFSEQYPSKMNLWSKLLTEYNTKDYNTEVQKAILRCRVLNKNFDLNNVIATCTDYLQYAEKFIISEHCLFNLKKSFENNTLTGNINIPDVLSQYLSPRDNSLYIAVKIVEYYADKFKNFEEYKLDFQALPLSIDTATGLNDVVNRKRKSSFNFSKKSKHKSKKIIVVPVDKNKEKFDQNFHLPSILMIDPEIQIAALVEAAWSTTDIIKFVKNYQPLSSDLLSSPSFRLTYLRTLTPDSLYQSTYIKNILESVSQNVNLMSMIQELFLNKYSDSQRQVIENNHRILIQQEEYLLSLRLSILIYTLDKLYSRVKNLNLSLSKNLQSLEASTQLQNLLLLISTFNQIYEANRLSFLKTVKEKGWETRELIRKRFASKSDHYYIGRDTITGQRKSHINATQSKRNLFSEITSHQVLMKTDTSVEFEPEEIELEYITEDISELLTTSSVEEEHIVFTNIDEILAIDNS